MEGQTTSVRILENSPIQWNASLSHINHVRQTSTKDFKFRSRPVPNKLAAFGYLLSRNPPKSAWDILKAGFLDGLQIRPEPVASVVPELLGQSESESGINIYKELWI